LSNPLVGGKKQKRKRLPKRNMNNRGDKLTQLFRRNGDGTKKSSAEHKSINT
jgi:hypothetical protein